MGSRAGSPSGENSTRRGGDAIGPVSYRGGVLGTYDSPKYKVHEQWGVSSLKDTYGVHFVDTWTCSFSDRALRVRVTQAAARDQKRSQDGTAGQMAAINNMGLCDMKMMGPSMRAG